MKTLGEVRLINCKLGNTNNSYDLVLNESRLNYLGEVVFTAKTLIYVLMVVIQRIVTAKDVPMLGINKPVLQNDKIVVKPLEIGDDLILLTNVATPYDLPLIPPYYINNYIANYNPTIPEVVHIDIDNTFRKPHISVRAKRVWSYKEIQAIVEKTVLMTAASPESDVVKRMMSTEIYL